MKLTENVIMQFSTLINILKLYKATLEQQRDTFSLNLRKGSLKDIQVVNWSSCNRKCLNYNLDNYYLHYTNNSLSSKAFGFEYAEFISILLRDPFRMLNKLIKIKYGYYLDCYLNNCHYFKPQIRANFLPLTSNSQKVIIPLRKAVKIKLMNNINILLK
jgi:hypothetical protein